jgi:4-carboxymuconolactone decarboxylase
MTRGLKESRADTDSGRIGPDRLPSLPETRWTPEQRRHAEEIIKGPRGALVSPFVPLLRSPELMSHAQRMGEYLRYRSALGQRLSEFAILLTARHWSQPVEWSIHAPIAEREGVSRETIEAISEDRCPPNLTDDESTVYAFCSELQCKHAVSDRTWLATIERFGERGAVDLIGILGYYSFLSMVMNAARTEVPHSSAPSLPGRNTNGTRPEA